MSTSLQPVYALAPGANLEAYVHAVNGIPLLSVEQERELAERLYYQQGHQTQPRIGQRVEESYLPVLQLGQRLRRTSQPEGQGEDGRSQQRVEQQMLHS